jgi:hypothetical protein
MVFLHAAVNHTYSRSIRQRRAQVWPDISGCARLTGKRFDALDLRDLENLRIVLGQVLEALARHADPRRKAIRHAEDALSGILEHIEDLAIVAFDKTKQLRFAFTLEIFPCNHNPVVALQVAFSPCIVMLISFVFALRGKRRDAARART